MEVLTGHEEIFMIHSQDAFRNQLVIFRFSLFCGNSAALLQRQLILLDADICIHFVIENQLHQLRVFTHILNILQLLQSFFYFLFFQTAHCLNKIWENLKPTGLVDR